MNKQEILSELKENTKNKSVKLPESIGFKLSKRVLYITISDEGVSTNMHDNKSAFEGWAICLKAHLPNFIDRVSICWNDIIPETKVLRQHYERFKYRVFKFLNTYEWVENGSDVDLSYFENEIDKWVVNFPDGLANENPTGAESILEKEYVAKNKDNREVINRQLPVGVFDSDVSKKNMVMPSGSSQIDAWALDKGSLYIYELKKPDNKPIGIISELMYYVNIMNDLKEGRIKYPEDAKQCAFRDVSILYDAINTNKIDSIEGVFLAENIHSLISDKVIELINNDILKKQNINYSHDTNI